jgi:hypothetical protein
MMYDFYYMTGPLPITTYTPVRVQYLYRYCVLQVQYIKVLVHMLNIKTRYVAVCRYPTRRPGCLYRRVPLFSVFFWLVVYKITEVIGGGGYTGGGGYNANETQKIQGGTSTTQHNFSI